MRSRALIYGGLLVTLVWTGVAGTGLVTGHWVLATMVGAAATLLVLLFSLQRAGIVLTDHKPKKGHRRNYLDYQLETYEDDRQDRPG